MKKNDSALDQTLDRLLSERWERAAQRVDASELLQRVRRSREPEATRCLPQGMPVTAQPADSTPVVRTAANIKTTRRSRLPQWLSGVVLAAVVLLVALLMERHSSAVSANAALVLRDLQSVYLEPLDRCYRTQYEPDPRYWDPANQLEGPSQSVMWTRGDCFWAECTFGPHQLLLGRQRDGALWLRLSPQRAFVYYSAPEDLPQELALICAANSLSVPRLVEEVLADFDLQAAAPDNRDGESGQVIWATLKPGRTHPVVSAALLEVDPADHSLMRLVLWMVREGQPRGTVTYTFLKSARLDEAHYELRSHLDEDALIDTSPEPQK